MAFSFIQYAGDNGNGSPESGTFSSTPTVGNLILVNFTVTSAGGGVNANESVTDNQTPANTYTKIGTVISSANGQSSWWWAKVATASGTFTVTASWVPALGSNDGLSIMEVSGIDTTNPVDGSYFTVDYPGFTAAYIGYRGGNATYSNSVCMASTGGNLNLSGISHLSFYSPSSVTTEGIQINGNPQGFSVNWEVGYGVCTVAGQQSVYANPTNAAVNLKYNAIAIVLKPAGPTITSSPTDVKTRTGLTATFSVTATGSGTVTYQWKKNGSAIGGATSSSYTTAALTPSDDLSYYSVDVTDTNGTVTSYAAQLRVANTPAMYGVKA